MDANTLTAELHRWASEYASVTATPINVPDALWGFLARRMAEARISTVKEPWDVVTAKVAGGAIRKVRVVSHDNRRVSVEYVDTGDGAGFGLVPYKDVKEQHKLAGILDRLDGK